MVSVMAVLALCVAATASISTAQEAVPTSVMPTQSTVVEHLPASSLDSTAVIDPLENPTMIAAIPGEEPRSPSNAAADSRTVASATPVLSAVPAVTPSQNPMSPVRPSGSLPISEATVTSIGSTPTKAPLLVSETTNQPVDAQPTQPQPTPPLVQTRAPVTTEPLATEAARPTTETMSQPVDAAQLTQPAPQPVETEAPTTTEPLVTEAAAPAVTAVSVVRTETPTMAPVATIPRLQNISKPTNGTKIRGNGRLKLGLNVTVDDAGNVRLGVKGHLQGNGTVQTKSGKLLKGGGEVQGEADIDTGINIGRMRKGGANYGGKVDVGGGFEVEKPSKPSAGYSNVPSGSPTVVATPDVRSNDEVPVATSAVDSAGAVGSAVEVPVAQAPMDTSPQATGSDGRGSEEPRLAVGSGELPVQSSA